MKVLQELIFMQERAASFEAATSGGPFKTFYHIAMIPLAIITLVLIFLARPSTAEKFPEGFRKFQICFLSVWVFAVAAEWLQTPYVYALYAAYGFPRHEIAQLYVAQFLSHMVFSTFAGVISDRFGKKKSALLYAVLCVVSCLTRHVKHYEVLMLGRITGGIASCLVFTCFESWMVCEFLTRFSFSPGLLEYMFRVMHAFMYVIAIITGFVGQALADGFKFQPYAEGSLIYLGGDLVPHDAAIVCCVIGFVLILALWGENYGQDESVMSMNIIGKFTDATCALFQDPRLIFLCSIVACFQGSVYCFVFNWTPAVDSKVVPPPYGLINAAWMMACTCGAAIATITEHRTKPGQRLVGAFALSTVAMAVAASAVASTVPKLALSFAAFVVFKFCCGVFFPSAAGMKVELVPEELQATMSNIYQVPMNAIVVATLLSNLSFAKVFGVTAILQGVAFVSLCVVMKMTKMMGRKGTK